MNSPKLLIPIGLLLVALAFAAGYALKGRNDDVSTSPTPSPTPTASVSVSVSPTPKPVSHAVRLTASGPVPKTLTIRAGDSVTFTNETNTAYWPASDPHPTHDKCPGFDARRGLARGDTYALTFATARTCTYHDHLDPFNALTGSIVVQ